MVRFCYGKAIQLIKALPADGRWRLVVFDRSLQNAASTDRLL